MCCTLINDNVKNSTFLVLMQNLMPIYFCTPFVLQCYLFRTATKLGVETIWYSRLPRGKFSVAISRFLSSFITNANLIKHRTVYLRILKLLYYMISIMDISYDVADSCVFHLKQKIF